MPTPGNAKIIFISRGKRRTDKKYKTSRMSYTQGVAEAFDFTTTEILDWELEAIHRALLEKKIIITIHARRAARDDKIGLIELLETILVGIPVSKDLPDNDLQRVPGINYEHRISDQRWIRVKVAWIDKYAIITVYKI